jgi:hypothetical protein
MKKSAAGKCRFESALKKLLALFLGEEELLLIGSANPV